jgi:endonuclease YncB( thermonuclease family)
VKTLRNLVFLPGRLVIRWIDGRKAANGVGPLNVFQRGAVHAFLGLVAFILLANVTAPTPASTVRAESTSGGTTTTPTHSTTNTPATTSRLPHPESSGEEITVSRVIDGDTFELADGRTVRVLGIDSCETGTYGGEEAKRAAEGQLQNQFNGIITMTKEPSTPDTDRHGRLLRYVQLDSGQFDFGEHMVKYDHTGVYQGGNDASAAYLQRLYAADLEYAQSPPSGRECADPYADYRGGGSGGGSVDLDDDYNMPDGALTGGYCARKWWC